MKNQHVRGFSVFPVLMALSAASPSALAQPAAAPVKPAGVEACQACHGPGGISVNPAIPNLAGQKPDYLAGQLKAFKAGDRKNDLMNALARQLSDADMKAIGQYFGALPAAAAPATQTASAAIHSRMTLPANFPAGFTLYDTDESVDGPIAMRYANAIALRAARAGQPLPDGSVIIVANHAREKDAAGKPKAGAIQAYTGMESRAGWGEAIPVLLRNGDWDYEIGRAHV